MIHYTLLPEEEIKRLKREYRTRVFIVFLYFLSFSVLIGIVSLIPAYLYSYIQEKEALLNLENIKDKRKGSGVDTVLSELKDTNEIIKKIKIDSSSLSYSDMISRIISNKDQNIKISTFNISTTKTATTSTSVVSVSGKSGTRDSLLTFKNKLESDPLISKVELPVSNLAKNRDLNFSLKVSIYNK